MNTADHLANVSNANPAVRESAALALGDSTEAVQALIGLLDDESPAVRQAAARSLGKSGAREAVEPLLTAQGSSEDSFRQIVSESLLHLGAQYDIVPDLLARTKSPNPYSRKSAIWVLGELRDKRALEATCLALADEQDFVRSAATFAFEKLAAVDHRAAHVLEMLAETGEVKAADTELLHSAPSFRHETGKLKAPDFDLGRFESVPIPPISLLEKLDLGPKSRLGKLDLLGDRKLRQVKKDNGMLSR